jgi:tetratricopeptide (TPR) repeat protein
VDAYICRGAAYYKKGDYDKTIVDCTTAIKLDPMDVGDYNRLPGSVYQIRGLAYQRLGKWSEGQADVEKAKELGYK